MTPIERNDLVRDIARRVFAEEQSGRRVDPQRLAWAAEVLDRRQQPMPAGARAGAAS